MCGEMRRRRQVSKGVTWGERRPACCLRGFGSSDLATSALSSRRLSAPRRRRRRLPVAAIITQGPPAASPPNGRPPRPPQRWRGQRGHHPRHGSSAYCGHGDDHGTLPASTGRSHAARRRPWWWSTAVPPVPPGDRPCPPHDSKLGTAVTLTEAVCRWLLLTAAGLARWWCCFCSGVPTGGGVTLATKGALAVEFGQPEIACDC